MTLRGKQRESPGPNKICALTPYAVILRAPAALQGERSEAQSKDLMNERSESQGTIKTSPSKSKIFPFRFAPVKMTVIVNTAFQSPLSNGARRNDASGEKAKSQCANP
jgi:hypothetical protein